ncbi:hypothetical protein MRX96_037067, partial [Rhipicephalus microplus]
MKRQRHNSVATGTLVVFVGLASNGAGFCRDWRLNRLELWFFSPGAGWWFWLLVLPHDDPAGVRQKRTPVTTKPSKASAGPLHPRNHGGEVTTGGRFRHVDVAEGKDGDGQPRLWPCAAGLRPPCHSGRGFAETKAAEITMRVRSPAATITEFLDLALLCTGDVRFWLRNNSSVPEARTVQPWPLHVWRDDEATAQLGCHRNSRAPRRPGVDWGALMQGLQAEAGWNSSSFLEKAV